MPKFRQTRLSAAAILLTAALGLSGCTTAGSSYSLDDGQTEEGRLYGEYLAGRYAYNIDDAKARASYYSRAFSRAPENAEIGAKAIRAAISDNDLPLARALSIEMSSLDRSEPLSRLVLGASDMARGDYAKAKARLKEQPDDAALGVMMAFLELWSDYGTGDSQTAIEILDSIEVGGYFDIMASLQKAKIYSETNQRQKAENEFALVETTGLSRIQTVLAKADHLSLFGDDEAALEALKTFDRAIGGIESGPILTAIKTLESGASLPAKMTPAQHASAALIDPAGAFFGQRRDYDTAEIYLRMALILDPGNQNARLWLGNILERMERKEDANAVYNEIPKDSDYIVSARLSQANLLFRMDKDDAAIEMLKKLNVSHPTSLTREALGTAYLIKEDYESALPFYDELVKSMSEEELQNDPTALYHRGICLSEAGQWEAAVTDFRRVLSIKPDYADVLNYLGYTWVDRGENLAEAFDMIRQAVNLEPESGAIIDSLGWAHYKLGQYGEARIHLEDAAAKSADSATIIDHLGDVYWKLGRFREAGFQWERALDFDPTDKERARIEAKLKGGLDAAKDMP